MGRSPISHRGAPPPHKSLLLIASQKVQCLHNVRPHFKFKPFRPLQPGLCLLVLGMQRTPEIWFGVSSEDWSWSVGFWNPRIKRQGLFSKFRIQGSRGRNMVHFFIQNPRIKRQGLFFKSRIQGSMGRDHLFI